MQESRDVFAVFTEIIFSHGDVLAAILNYFGKFFNNEFDE